MRLMILFWLLSTIFFNGIKGADLSDCSFQEFLRGIRIKNLVKLEQSYYSFAEGKKIYVNDEPLSFWLQQNAQGALPTLTLFPALPSQPVVKISIAPFGHQSCVKSFDVVNGNGMPVVLDLSACAPQPSAGCKPLEIDGKKYVPFKVWTENGHGMIQTSDNVYVFEEEKAMMNTRECDNIDDFQAHYGQLDYTSLKPMGTSPASGPFWIENGKEYIKLKNQASVVWLKIKVSSPEYYILIETTNGQLMEKSFKVKLEVNGIYPPTTHLQPLPNGAKINIKNINCVFDYKFFGYVRYIITVNEPGFLKASFYDVQSGENLKLYYLPNEANGIPTAVVNVADLPDFDLLLTTTPSPISATTNFSTKIVSADEASTPRTTANSLTTPSTTTKPTTTTAKSTTTPAPASATTNTFPTNEASTPTPTASANSLPANPVTENDKTKAATEASHGSTTTGFLLNGEMVLIGVILFFVLV